MNSTIIKNVIVVYRGSALWFGYSKGEWAFALSPHKARQEIKNLRSGGWKVIYGDDPEHAKISA
jgi:hypothetical protein